MNERVKELRKFLGLSGEKFGERIRLTKMAVSKMETARTGITEQNILAICREFNVNENWLRNGEGEMFKEATEDERLTSFIASIQNDALKKRFILALANLDDKAWQVLQDLVYEIAKE